MTARACFCAHKPGWGTRYSILAGFVEPGESLEDCVRREAREEVGVELVDLAYAGSQPWPYPHQLMVGFTARYAGGEIRVDGEELDARGLVHARHAAGTAVRRQSRAENDRSVGGAADGRLISRSRLRGALHQAGLAAGGGILVNDAALPALCQ